MNIGEKRSVVEGIKPVPGGKSLIIVSAVEIESFYILFDDFDEFQVGKIVGDTEPAFVIGVHAIDNFIILNFEFLYF